jgi:hypothetical protein
MQDSSRILGNAYSVRTWDNWRSVGSHSNPRRKFELLSLWKVVQEGLRVASSTSSGLVCLWLCSILPSDITNGAARQESVSRRSFLECCCLKVKLSVSQALTQVRTQCQFRIIAHSVVRRRDSHPIKRPTSGHSDRECASKTRINDESLRLQSSFLK